MRHADGRRSAWVLEGKMKLFVWNYVERASDNYHDCGGIVVIADSLERAREIVAERTGKDDKPCEAMTKIPDLTRDCEGPEYVAIHPDAGCC